MDSLYQRLDDISASFLKQASNACKKVLERASTVEPIFLWPSPTETIVAPLEYQMFNLIFAECEHHIELADEDVVLPQYCSRALNAFDHYRLLEDDWDGEGSEAPTEASLNDAMYFLRTLGSNIQEIAEARPMIDAEGIPGIFWSMNSKYLSISFYGDFTLTYFYRDKQTEEQEVKTLSLDDADSIKHLLYLIEEI
jgi:hypothetical protein